MNAVLEPLYTPEELAKLWKFHPSTIRRWCADLRDEGKAVFTHREVKRGKREYNTYRLTAQQAMDLFQQKCR